MALTEQASTLSVDDRIALGRAARDRRPRGSLATWRPTPYRLDPIDLLAGQEADRVPALLPLRHARIGSSAFAFFRGSAIVMAADLGAMSTSGLTVQLSGDAHLANFGVFLGSDRRPAFGEDDFDETLPGPFEWDVLRLATSFVVAGLERTPTAASDSAARARAGAGRKAALAAAQSYRTTMRDNAGRTAVSLWYARDDEETLRAWARTEPRSNRLLADVKAGRAGARAESVRSAVEHFTTVKGGRPQFAEGTTIARIGTADPLADHLGEVFAAYRRALPPERAELLSRYEIVDTGHKTVGVGSVGLPDFVLLVQGRLREDLLILQLKQTQASALLAGVPSPAEPAWRTDAERIVLGARRSQPGTDVFLGAADLPGGPSRYVRQLRDGKWAPDLATLSNGRLVDFARLCGHALARSHARTGDPIAIAAYLGKSQTFDTAVLAFARRYADQVATDARAYRRALGSERLPAAATVSRRTLLDGLRESIE